MLQGSTFVILLNSMCFAIPKRVEKVGEGSVIVENGQVVHTGRLRLKAGDYILVYANLAIEKVSKMQAMYTKNLIKQ